MIDTHAHLLMLENNKELIENMQNDDMEHIVTIGTTVEDSIQSVEFANKFEKIYATVGIYPEYSINTTAEDLVTIEELAKSEKVVAIGEIGLDYHYNYDKESQKELFVKQLEIADRVGKPFCIHCRDAASDVYEVLKENKHLINHSGLMHCYSEGKEWYQKFLDLGLYLSFSGNITFKKTDRSFLKDIPLDRIVVETDSPYLSPEPFRGRKNEPKMVKFVIEKIASEIGISSEELKKITSENAKRFYNIG
ncbi:MAG: TatD family hydrolase [Clostridia bacterium]|nr:TatD family hydrolase [Clostridia bacterium]